MPSPKIGSGRSLQEAANKKAQVAMAEETAKQDVAANVAEDTLGRSEEEKDLTRAWEIATRWSSASDARFAPTPGAPRATHRSLAGAMFVGARDTQVPTKTGLELWRALGEPELYILPGNHESASLCFGFVLRRSERFLREGR
jgi:hypothetical protein